MGCPLGKITANNLEPHFMTMNERPEKNLRNITTKEELIAFLQAVYHEREPNLYRCRWAPCSENEVYLWYKGDCKVVNGSVVEVLRSIPAKKHHCWNALKPLFLI